MDFNPSIPSLPTPNEATGGSLLAEKQRSTVVESVNSLIEDHIYKSCQIDAELAALLEPFRGLDFPLSPKYFLEGSESYVGPRYLTSSLTKKDIDNLCREAENRLALKEYSKAAQLFKEVCHYNHLELKGWEGLGECYKRDQKVDQSRILDSIAAAIIAATVVKNNESDIRRLFIKHGLM